MNQPIHHQNRKLLSYLSFFWIDKSEMFLNAYLSFLMSFIGITSPMEYLISPRRDFMNPFIKIAVSMFLSNPSFKSLTSSTNDIKMLLLQKLSIRQGSLLSNLA